jgi:hypothetical protein
MVVEQSQWHVSVSLSKEAKEEELNSVLASTTFARSDQLRSFLRYVCKVEMEGRVEELNEYLVGVEALGRPESYSPADDSSVRSRAWELRQKLLKLYSSERLDSHIRIELPRGGYAPQYLVMDDTTLAVESHQVIPALAEAASSATPRNYSLPVAAACLVIGVLFSAAFFSLRPKPRTDTIDPVLKEAWGPLLEPEASDMLVMANALYLLIRPEMPPGFNTHKQYPVPQEIYNEYREKRPLERDRKLSMFTSSNTVQMGYINGLVATTSILQKARASFTLLPERAINASSMRNHNVVLFGAPQDSMAVTEMLSGTTFRFGYDPTFDLTLSKPGAKPYFLLHREGTTSDASTYGLITVLPSLGASPNGKRTVIFSGISSVGAQAAAEFFSSAVHMKDLRGRFQKEGTKGFPPSYQVVVHCKAFDSMLMSFDYADSAILALKN